MRTKPRKVQKYDEFWYCAGGAIDIIYFVPVNAPHEYLVIDDYFDGWWKPSRALRKQIREYEFLCEVKDD